ncbi:MAG: hypothetical protein EP336_18500 [Rhodobacteraceae bacterium]|nr:MAG: hypothetical protein EP336_18500 [Paracoccaceae bacterium]
MDYEVALLRGKKAIVPFLTSTLAVSFVVAGNGAMAQDKAEVVGPKLYSFDMFSLLSFGLTITALLLSFFMAWLSWQFYSKSVEASEKTHETVTKIEALVAGVQTNISEIVNRAVTHWVEGSEASSLGEANHDLMRKFEELEAAVSGDNVQDQKEVLDDIKALRAQVEQLSRTSREMQIKNIFPGFKSEQKVVEASQEITSSEEGAQTGLFRIIVLRPTNIATATLRFDPAFEKAPDVSAELIASPVDDTSTITAKAGTASKKNCNFHINSRSELPKGEYIFEFKAVLGE